MFVQILAIELCTDSLLVHSVAVDFHGIVQLVTVDPISPKYWSSP